MPKARITLTSLYELLQEQGRTLKTHGQLLQDYTGRFQSSKRRQERIIAELVLVKERLEEHSAILNPLRERVELL